MAIPDNDEWLTCETNYICKMPGIINVSNSLENMDTQMHKLNVNIIGVKSEIG